MRMYKLMGADGKGYLSEPPGGFGGNTRAFMRRSPRVAASNASPCKFFGNVPRKVLRTMKGIPVYAAI